MDQSVIPQPPDQTFYYVLASVLFTGLVWIIWFVFTNLIKKVESISVVQAEHSEKHAVQKIVNEDVSKRIDTHAESIKRLERTGLTHAEEVAVAVVAKLKYLQNE